MIKDMKEAKKQMFHQHQQERERRLLEAAKKSVSSMNTAKRVVEKEEKKTKIIGKLSVIVGPNRRGDIVVREGDNLQILVRSFMASYGLKRELTPTIMQSLEVLIKNNENKKNSKAING